MAKFMVTTYCPHGNREQAVHEADDAFDADGHLIVVADKDGGASYSAVAIYAPGNWASVVRLDTPAVH